MSLSIDVVHSESGDWSVVLVNGQVDYAGHSIPTFYWVNLFNSFGFNIKEREISDENMQESKFYEGLDYA